MTALRDFIAALERRGRLVRIREAVHWKYEIGRIARARTGPLLFENITDYPGARLFTNGLCGPAGMALALGLNDGAASLRAMAPAVRRGFARPIGPVIAASADVPENRITEGIDLARLPVPWWSEQDSGRYIGTWHLNITRDPETGARNVGVYRMQIVGPAQTTVSVSPRSHLSRHLRNAERKGESLPMAVAIGVDERLVVSAAAAPAYGVDEFALAGGLAGRPVALAPCLTQPLEVPADAEVVIEGRICPETRVTDGPFLDYAGIPSTNPDAHVFEATALLFRNDPVFRGSAVGRPGGEDHQVYALLAMAGLNDFHGSRIRHAVQSFLLQRGAFGLFQAAGRCGSLVRGSKKTRTVTT